VLGKLSDVSEKRAAGTGRLSLHNRIAGWFIPQLTGGDRFAAVDVTFQDVCVVGNLYLSWN